MPDTDKTFTVAGIERVQGSAVIASFRPMNVATGCTLPYRVLLLAPGGRFREWVVASLPDGSPEWGTGTYRSDYSAAWETYVERCESHHNRVNA